MPLDEVARRYANNLFTQDMERLSSEYREKSTAVAVEFTGRNMARSGGYFTRLTQVGIEHITALAQARADSLLKAYKLAKLQIDNEAVSEIHQEVEAFCKTQGKNLIGKVSSAVRQAQTPEGVAASVAATIERAVSSISNGIRLKLLAIRDEDILVTRSQKATVVEGPRVKSNAVFLSHAAADAGIASVLKEAIETVIPGSDVFVSSDGEDLLPGDPWVETILRKLKEAAVLVVLATDHGMNRRWVWYESGAGWSRGLRVIPCCVGELRKGQLVPPFFGYQALNVDEEGDLRSLFVTLAATLKLSAGEPDLSAIIAGFAKAAGVPQGTNPREIAQPSVKPYETARHDAVMGKVEHLTSTERDLLRFLLLRGETVGSHIYGACQVADTLCTQALNRLTQEGLLLMRIDMSHPLLEQPRYWRANSAFEEVVRELLFPRKEQNATPAFSV